jgi:hypothetical protein
LAATGDDAEALPVVMTAYPTPISTSTMATTA